MSTAIPVGRGLYKLSPEMLAEAQDRTSASITRIVLTLVGVSLFCALLLFVPDESLLIGEEKRLDFPFTGPVSFRGFLVVGPATMVGLRVYVQFYVEHWKRLEKIQSRLPRPIRPPALMPMRNLSLRWVHWFALFLLLPSIMIWFTWKAAIFPAWGSGLACIAAAVLAGHLVLLLTLTWPVRAAATVLMVFFTAAIVYGEGPFSRPANLFRADLSNQWLPGIYLRGANLQYANLHGANLSGALLRGADLGNAHLANADLTDADLSFAKLVRAQLEGQRLADLEGADLAFANLTNADLVEANLRDANLVVCP